MRISIEQYVAVENPNAARQLLRKYGVPTDTSIKDLADKLELITYKYREIALNDLANVDTPYRRLILSTSKDLIVKEVATEVKSNCDGCGGTCGDKKSNAEGDSVNVVTKADVKTEEPTKKEVTVESKRDLVEGMDKYVMPSIVILGLITLVILAKK